MSLFVLEQLRIAELQVCLSTNVSLVQGEGFVTGQHHCSLSACQIRAVPIKRKLNHPLESLNLPQDSEGLIYCTWRFYAELIFQCIFLCRASITYLMQLVIPLA